MALSLSQRIHFDSSNQTLDYLTYVEFSFKMIFFLFMLQTSMIKQTESVGMTYNLTKEKPSLVKKTRSLRLLKKIG